MSAAKRGALIVLEGVDRSGKSTQCRKLVESLKQRNIPAELLRFPDRTTPTGKLIGEYLTSSELKLNDKAIHLLFSANRWESFDRMKQLIEAGVTLVVDRYSYSGIAFSSIKKGMDYEWCCHMENGLLKPDLVMLLTLSRDEMAKRPGFGEERYESSDIQEKVAKVFNKMSCEEDNWEAVSANGTIEEVQEVLVQKTLDKVRHVQNGEPVLLLDFTKKTSNGHL